MNYEFFEAYDGKYLDNHSKFLRSGEIGCAKSHIELWKKCLELNVPLLILEDDSIYRKNFVDILKKLEIHNFYNCSSILFLGGSPRGFDRIDKTAINDMLSHKMKKKSWFRMEAYVIFPTNLKSMIDNYNYETPIDIYINNRMDNIMMLNHEITYPGNSNIDSDTTPNS